MLKNPHRSPLFFSIYMLYCIIRNTDTFEVKLKILLSWFLILCCATGVAQANHVEERYLSNPQKLESALMHCPQQHPAGITCDQLNHVGETVNRLVAELQMNPQAYGSSIIALQTTLSQQLVLAKQQPSPQLQQQIAHNQQTLRERLSVIKWLESPRRSH